MIKNFIFDVDRTLIDSYKPELETLKEALFIVTKKTYSDEIMSKLTILTTDEFFKKLGIEKNSDTMNDINHYWGVLLQKRRIHLFDGIKQMLVKLKKKGFFLGIATSRTKEELNELDELLENNYNENEKLGNRRTTKKDNFLHGYGISNIKNAVEKYNGTCTITKENEKFILKILIPIK